MLSFRPSLIGILVGFAVTPLAALTITQLNVSMSEDFDTLASATGSIVPAGWQFIESGSGANATYGAGPGSSNLGNTYSFGATGSTDRAFGALRTGSVAATIGTLVINETGSTIDQLTIEFTTEQWRLGALNRVDQMDFAHSPDATSVDTGTWFDVDALDLINPVMTGATGALDGNAAENQLLVSHTIAGLNFPSGTSLWLRWVDFDASGSDDGLALDNFSLTAMQAGGDAGGGGGIVEAVPDRLPISVVIAVMGGLLVLGASVKRNHTA